MQLSYGGDRYKAYEGGMPVVTNLSLNFKELDFITRERCTRGILVCILIKTFPVILYDSVGPGTFKDVTNLLEVLH